MGIWASDEGGEACDEGHRLEDELSHATTAGTLQGQLDAIVFEAAQAAVADRGTREIPDEAFELSAPAGLDTRGGQRVSNETTALSWAHPALTTQAPRAQPSATMCVCMVSSRRIDAPTIHRPRG